VSTADRLIAAAYRTLAEVLAVIDAQESAHLITEAEAQQRVIEAGDTTTRNVRVLREIHQTDPEGGQ